MQHHFNVEIANDYGLSEAIILENLFFWVTKNKANEKNYYDGHYWTYNSVKAFEELFPYMSGKTIRNVLKHLEEEELILTGNYNKSSYDRTKWYALTDKAFRLFNLGNSILPKGQMESPEKANEFDQNGEPIPYNKPIQKPLQKTNKRKVFTPPTLEDVKAYVQEKGLSINAEHFFNYFNDGDWYDSKGNKVKNWKQKALTWNSYQPAKPSKPEYKPETTDDPYNGWRCFDGM